MDNERGLTLVEILASVVIISIILISTAQILIQSNKTAEVNKSQLVVIHLSNAMLERLKMEPEIIQKALPATDSWDTCIDVPLKKESEDFSKVTINNVNYTVSACLTPKQDAKDLNLINVQVSVKDKEGKRKSKIEGYVQL